MKRKKLVPYELFVGRFSSFGFVKSFNNSVYAFGGNSNFQLGLGHRENIQKLTIHPSFESIKKLYVVKDISTGSCHSIFVTRCGKVLSAGSRKEGQVCQGNPFRPSRVTIKYTENVTEVKTFSKNLIVNSYCGYYSTYFITKNGNVFSCGYNNEGNLGLGNRTRISTPEMIAKLEDVFVVSMCAGWSHAIFLSVDGDVYGCGSNWQGRLGQKTTYFPALFTRLPRRAIKKVECGQFFSVFLTKTGEVYVCGMGEGKGNGTEDVHNEMNVNLNKKIEDVSNIVCGQNHTFFSKEDGSLYSCGGDGSNGKLGLGYNVVHVSLPQQLKQKWLGHSKELTVVCGSSTSFIISKHFKCRGCGNSNGGKLFCDENIDTRTPQVIGSEVLDEIVARFRRSGGRKDRIDYLIEKSDIMSIL